MTDEEHRPDLVGDGYDPEPLWKAEDVAGFVGVPVKSVYELPIPRVRISARRIRWRPRAVRDWMRKRESTPA